MWGSSSDADARMLRHLQQFCNSCNSCNPQHATAARVKLNLIHLTGDSSDLTNNCSPLRASAEEVLTISNLFFVLLFWVTWTWKHAFSVFRFQNFLPCRWRWETGKIRGKHRDRMIRNGHFVNDGCYSMFSFCKRRNRKYSDWFFPLFEKYVVGILNSFDSKGSFTSSAMYVSPCR